ncbi:MAG: hypothetical protein V4644_01540 [Patescibacteria group bacterium]
MFIAIIKTIGGAVWFILTTFIGDELLPTVMLNVGLALVTIFIPVAIFLFQETRNELDRMVMLKYVIQLKKLFCGLCLVFLPLFLWMFELLRWPLLACFIAGVWLIVSVLFASYQWLRTLDTSNTFDEKNYRNRLRNVYLSSARDWEEKETIWNLTWKKEANIEAVLDERNLVQKFSANLNALLDAGKADIYARFLGTFDTNIGKRIMYDWPTFGSLFEAALNWYWRLYEKGHPTDGEEDRLYEAEFATSSVLQKLVVSALEKGPAFVLFDDLKKHVVDKPIEYMEQLLVQVVCRFVFDGSESSRESFDIWNHYFPQEWKITKASLNNEANLIPRVWFNQFFEWAQRRIWNQEKKDFDRALDEVAKELFPELEPSWWAYILIFLFSPWGDGDRMGSLVRTRKTFGFGSRISISSYGSMDQATEELHRRIEQERAATIDFVLSVFGNTFTAEKLTEWVADLKALDLETESVEDLVRRNYVEIFEQILKVLRERDQG